MIPSVCCAEKEFCGGVSVDVHSNSLGRLFFLFPVLVEKLLLSPRDCDPAVLERLFVVAIRVWAGSSHFFRVYWQLFPRTPSLCTWSSLLHLFLGGHLMRPSVHAQVSILFVPTDAMLSFQFSMRKLALSCIYSGCTWTVLQKCEVGPLVACPALASIVATLTKPRRLQLLDYFWNEWIAYILSLIISELLFRPSAETMSRTNLRLAAVIYLLHCEYCIESMANRCRSEISCGAAVRQPWKQFFITRALVAFSSVLAFSISSRVHRFWRSTESQQLQIHAGFMRREKFRDL